MYLVVLVASSFIITRLCISGCSRMGLVDRPDARKHHKGTVPLTGGIGIFLTILFGTLLLDIEPYNYQMLLIATGAFLVGVFDDMKHINAWIRLGIQYGAGILLATYGGIAIHNVGNLLAMGDIPLLLLTVPLTALSVAGLSNAYNMIDGIDGLASSLIALPLLVLYGLAVQAGHPSSEALLLMLVPLGIFLVFNLGPNNRILPKMFLGDSGSITLGFLVTASLVFLSQGENELIRPVTALWLVTVPLMDMLATMLRRAKNRVPLMAADRMHLHHTLIDTMGLERRGALVVLVLYGTSAAMLGLALEAIPPYLSLACYFALFIAHCAFVIKSESLGIRVRTKRSTSDLTTQG